MIGPGGGGGSDTILRLLLVSVVVIIGGIGLFSNFKINIQDSTWVKLPKQQQVHLQQVVIKVKVTQSVLYPGSGGQTVTGTKFIHWQSLAKKNGKYQQKFYPVQIPVCLPKPKS